MNEQQLNHIKYMLTLRYDPTEKPLIKPTKAKDWSSEIYEITGDSLEIILSEQLEQLSGHDVIGLPLSGGVDSPLLLHMIRKQFPTKHIVCTHYKSDEGEFERAKKYAERCKADLLVTVNHTILDKIEWMVALTREPIHDAFDYLNFQTLKEYGADVLVDGSGADELFGGYVDRIHNTEPPAHDLGRLIHSYIDSHGNDHVPDQANMFGNEIQFDWDDIQKSLLGNFSSRLTPVDNIFMADFNGKLVRHFVKKNFAFSRFYRLPVFSPFLTNDVRDYGTHLDASCKINGDIGKVPLRQIAARYKLYPPYEKYPFTHDIVEEWQNDMKKMEAINDLNDTDNLIYKEGIISYDWVKRHISNSDYMQRDYCVKFFQLIALENWLRRKGRGLQ